MDEGSDTNNEASTSEDELRTTEVKTNRGTKETVLTDGEPVDISRATNTGIIRALRQSEDRYRLLAENATDCIWTINPNTLRFTYISPSIQRLRGYTSDEAMKQTFYEILTEESLGIILNELKKEMDIEKSGTGDPDRTRTLELEMCHKNDYTIWTETTFSFLRDEEGVLTEILGVTRDITERRILQAKLLQSQKMEAIGKLAGGIAHDFNNLLTVIIGYTDMVYGSLTDRSLKDDLREVKEAANKAQSLTSQLLAFSRKQELRTQIIDINPIIKNIEKMIRRLIGEDIELRINFDEGIDYVKVDPSQIEQVIMNLTVNAKDAMPDGGALTIKTEELFLDEAYCQFDTNARPGKFICITVQDTGKGMGRDTLQHIFEPFFTKKEKGKGTGLGLSVVYGIIKQHEGWIKVDSKPRQGSIFRIYLPANSEKPKSETKSTAKIEKLFGQGERILLIEDEKNVREFIQKTLRRHGYNVFPAVNAQEAIELFQQENGNFHLIFSDVILPGKSGLQIVEDLLRLRESRNMPQPEGPESELKVLMSSGYTDGKSRWERITERGFPLLHKPYNLKTLLKTLREVIESDKA